ncbi:MAG: exosortase H-associated membrane protein [Chromatocurvus sp.]
MRPNPATTPARFFGLVLLLIPVTFVAWYALGSLLAAPAVWLSSLVLENWFPELIASVTLQDTRMMVMATLGEVNGRFLPAEEAGYQLGLPVDTRVLTYCIPFYAALHFATPMPGSWERFARALLVLWVLVILGLVTTTLKNFMLTFGERLLSLPQSPPADVIALAYQFNTLIVPPLAPILLWGLAVRETPVMRSLFPAALAHSSSSERDETDNQV